MIKPKRVWDNKKRTVRQWKKQVWEVNWDLKVNEGNRRSDADSSQFKVYDKTWETPEEPYKVYDKSWEEIGGGWGSVTLIADTQYYWNHEDNIWLVYFRDSTHIDCMSWQFTLNGDGQVQDFTVFSWSGPLWEKVSLRDWGCDADKLLFNLGLQGSSLIGTNTQINCYLKEDMRQHLENYLTGGDSLDWDWIIAERSVWNELVTFDLSISEMDENMGMRSIGLQSRWYPQELTAWEWTLYGTSDYYNKVLYNVDNTTVEPQWVFSLSYFTIEDTENNVYLNLFNLLFNRLTENSIDLKKLFGMYTETINIWGDEYSGYLSSFLSNPSSLSVADCINRFLENSDSWNMFAWSARIWLYTTYSEDNDDYFEFYVNDGANNDDVWMIQLSTGDGSVLFTITTTVPWDIAFSNWDTTFLTLDQWKAILDYDNRTSSWTWNQDFINELNTVLFTNYPSWGLDNLAWYLQAVATDWWKIVTWN